LVGTGLRREELCQLRDQDVRLEVIATKRRDDVSWIEDLEAPAMTKLAIRMYFSGSEADHEGGMMLVHGKGRKQRLVPIPAELRLLLSQYVYRRKDSRAAGRCDRFFRDRNGTPMTGPNLTTLMIRLGRRAGVDLHPHRLRHTFATSFMSHDGADVLHLKEICGWTTPAMANRYAKPTMAKMIRMVDSFSPVNQLR
jgi:integrase